MTTATIIREDENGKLIAIFPTLPGNWNNRNIVQWMNSRGVFVNSTETYEELIARTDEVSTSKENKFFAANLNKTYKLVEKATPAMHKQRRSVNNPDMLPQG